MFQSPNFIWNEIDNKDIGIYLVSPDDEDIQEYGFSYVDTVSKIDITNDTPFYMSEAQSVDQITLHFCLANSNNEALEWDDYTIEEICNLFMTKDFKPFVSYDNLDLTYYLKTIKIRKLFTDTKTGYLEITFQPYTNFAYRKYIKNIETRNGVMNTIIYNYSNLDKNYKPIIIIENLGDENTINTICNTSVNTETLEIKGLKKNERITIDNLYCTVINDKFENKFNLVNRKWIELVKNNNYIEINGNCKVSFKAQYPVMR